MCLVVSIFKLLCVVFFLLISKTQISQQFEQLIQVKMRLSGKSRGFLMKSVTTSHGTRSEFHICV